MGMRSATEGSGENKGLSEKMDSEEKEKILDALKEGQSWLDSNPEADAEEIKEKHKEIEGICAPIVSKYYGQGGGGGGGGAGEEDEEEAHDELGEQLFLQRPFYLPCVSSLGDCRSCMSAQPLASGAGRAPRRDDCLRRYGVPPPS